MNKTKFILSKIKETFSKQGCVTFLEPRKIVGNNCIQSEV